MQWSNLKLARAVCSDLKCQLSLLIYVLAIPLAYVHPLIALALHVVNAMMWFIPDRRIGMDALGRQ